MALVLRSRALGRRKRESEAALEARLRYAQGELDRAQAALTTLRDEQDDVIREAGRPPRRTPSRSSRAPPASCRASRPSRPRCWTGSSASTAVTRSSPTLMDITHANAQMARKAQGIAVMCGAPLGRRNQPASVYGRGPQRAEPDPQLPAGRDHAAQRYRAEGLGRRSGRPGRR
ncbi:hypothetical protein ACRAWF_07600 [Streptomyces sp. L7]